MRISTICCTGLLLVAGLGGGCRNAAPSAGPAGAFRDATALLSPPFIHNPAVEGRYDMIESIGSGGGFWDFDGDGDLDIYLLNGAWRNRPGETLRNALYRQEPDGRFVDVTAASGLGDPGYGMGMAVGDIDNDGDTDLYITNAGPDRLYRNNGDGTFTDVSDAWGVTNDDWGCSAAFLDVDADGWLDLIVVNYVAVDPDVICTDRAGAPDYCGPGAHPGVPDRLYRNVEGRRFADVGVATGPGSAAGKGLGVAVLDIDRNGYPDIYVANDGEPNHLWVNRGDGTFADEALRRGLSLNGLGMAEAGMGVVVGDVDGDLDMDLFLTHLRGETNTLYGNEGALGFRDVTDRAGLGGASLALTGFGTALIDIENDGALDIAVVNGRVTRGPLLAVAAEPGYWAPYAEPNLLFRNSGEGVFTDVSSANPALCEPVHNSRGLAAGDWDNDGGIDLLVMNEGGPARLLTNGVPDRGNWLTLTLIDPALQREAYGATAVISAGGRQWIRYLNPGGGFMSSHDPRLHVGLGGRTAVDSIRVRWPGGATEVFPGVPANQTIILYRGAGDAAGG